MSRMYVPSILLLFRREFLAFLSNHFANKEPCKQSLVWHGSVKNHKTDKLLAIRLVGQLCLFLERVLFFLSFVGFTFCVSCFYDCLSPSPTELLFSAAIFVPSPHLPDQHKKQRRRSQTYPSYFPRLNPFSSSLCYFPHSPLTTNLLTGTHSIPSDSLLIASGIKNKPMRL